MLVTNDGDACPQTHPGPVPTRGYFCFTAPTATPPTLLCTATLVNVPVTANCPENLPTFTSGMLPFNLPVVVLKTWSVETRSLLVASTNRVDLLTVYSAFVIVTVEFSFSTVTVPVFVVPCNVADTTAEVVAETLKAVTANVAVFDPDGTDTLAGTVTTAGSELLRVTTVPSAAAPVNVTVQVAAPPP